MLRNGWSKLELSLNRSSIVLLCLSLEERLREQFPTSALPDRTRLPPERKVATSVAVNRSAIVQAYRDLAVGGLVVQRSGSGSRVAPLRPGPSDRGARCCLVRKPAIVARRSISGGAMTGGE